MLLVPWNCSNGRGTLLNSMFCRWFAAEAVGRKMTTMSPDPSALVATTARACIGAAPSMTFTFSSLRLLHAHPWRLMNLMNEEEIKAQWHLKHVQMRT